MTRCKVLYALKLKALAAPTTNNFNGQLIGIVTEMISKWLPRGQLKSEIVPLLIDVYCHTFHIAHRYYYPAPRQNF